ncbi:lipopolysaccharide biosynthesis protein [Panacibacter ginsenosidivorans]|uniref:Lipopolysaccharide biosynthesis protein n=1 Tax=Panacibacter ginsenosidivorans TaxID=1813871 RepID=A0A5B8VH06_9BACT|nr:lipopolysaccharide biosynthesis protein [Panacibacter ginsenosidivorans]QEC69588.1 lipopolysaccharide biosynthesis protein [Panacibacter ginsenosidivorans]
MALSKQKLVKTGIWQVLNTVVVLVSQIGANAIMARYVTDVEFGLMAITNAFVNFACFFSEAGMGDALLQRKVVEPQHKNAALYFSVLVSVVLYVIFYFCAPLIADFYGKPELINILRVLGFSFILLSIGSSSLNLMQKNFNFKQVFFSDSLSLFASNILGVVLAMKGYGAWSVVWSILFYNAARMVMVWIIEPIPLKLGATLKHWKDLAGYGAGLTLIRINNYVSGFGIMLEIGKLVSIALLGAFERSYRYTNLPVRYIGDMLQKIMMPFMSKMQDEDEKLYVFFYRAQSFSNSLLVPISLFGLVFCKPIVFILLGHKWENAIIPMQILFLSLPFRITTKVADALMRSKQLVYRNAGRKFQYVVILCVGIYVGWLFDKNSLVGISTAVTLASVFNYVAMLLTIRRRVFTQGWQKLIISPFKNGLLLSVCIIAPAYGLYFLLNMFVQEQVVSFIIVTSIVGVILLFLFLKRPKWLGEDFADMQKEILKMTKGKGGGKKRKMMEEELKMQHDNDIPTVTEPINE